MTTLPAADVRFDADLIRRYDGRGPRYTSYPTAPEFSDDFNADTYRQFAARSNETGRPLSLYVHIPFCRSLCYYCGCNKIVTRNAERVSRYLRNLHREIEMQAALYSNSRRVEQLHLGGGTPTYLSDAQIAGLLDKLQSVFSFAACDQREFSIEVDPRTVSDLSIGTLADQGFNRLSLGIQDFDPAVQQAVNRVQSEASVSRLVNSARRHGFRSISFDLIYGLPRQSLQGFERTVLAAIALRPDRLSIYNYAHLPARFKGQRMIREQDLPSAEAKLRLLHNTIERLTAAGYVYVGMDHFALPDDDLVKARRQHTLQRNFQGYSTHKQCDLIGLGVSAIGHVADCFVQNALTTMDYEALVGNGHLPVHKGLAVDADDRLRADVIQQLMCYDSVDFTDFERRFGIDFRNYFDGEIDRLEPMVADGLVQLHSQGIEVTPLGRLLVRNIAMAFDRHLQSAADRTRFSRAI